MRAELKECPDKAERTETHPQSASCQVLAGTAKKRRKQGNTKNEKDAGHRYFQILKKVLSPHSSFVSRKFPRRVLCKIAHFHPQITIVVSRGSSEPSFLLFFKSSAAGRVLTNVAPRFLTLKFECSLRGLETMWEL